MADKLEMSSSSYVYFEDPKRFKKQHLPIEFARKVAAVLARHGVEPAEVMALAGLKPDEAEPEAAAVERSIPPVQYVQMSVALPSAAALTRMFEGLLEPLDLDASKAEIAEQLARLLPIGLQQVQGPLYEPATAEAPPRAAAPPPPANADRAPRSSPRT